MNTEKIEFILLYILVCIAMLRQVSWQRERLFSGRFKDDRYFGNRNKYKFNQYYKMFLFFMETIILMTCLSLNVTNGLFIKDEADISVKIESIANDLAQSSTKLSIIQEELEKRIEYVEELKNEAEIAENVISLTDEQVKAVQAKLNEELNANNGKSFMQDVLINTFFFVIGLIAPVIFKKFSKKTELNIDNSVNLINGDDYNEKKIDQMIEMLTAMKKNSESNS